MSGLMGGRLRAMQVYSTIGTLGPHGAEVPPQYFNLAVRGSPVARPRNVGHSVDSKVPSHPQSLDATILACDPAKMYRTIYVGSADEVTKTPVTLHDVFLFLART